MAHQSEITMYDMQINNYVRKN